MGKAEKSCKIYLPYCLSSLSLCGKTDCSLDGWFPCLPWVLTILVGVVEPTVILRLLTCSVLFSTCMIVKSPDRTWSRSMACLDKRLVHSELGNCGQVRELMTGDFVNLML